MKKLAMLIGGALALAACSTGAPRPPAAAVDPNNPLFAPAYMAQAGSSDQFEIQSSQVALQMSQNPQVQNIANMLIADHTRSSQMMVAAAQSADINPPPPALLPEHQALLDQVRAAGMGPQFDVTFRDIQVQAHQQALQLHQNYATSGDVPVLRTLAGQIVPVVQNHLNMLQGLQVALPAPPPPPPPPAQPPVRRSGERG